MDLIIILLLFLFGESQCTDTASFFGASYISVPLQEAKKDTDIRFRIMTKKSDALLFLAAGQTDYCLIRLIAGRLKVYINLGAGESTVTSPRGLRLDDLNWHMVSFVRKEADVTLTVDNIHITREKLPGSFFELNIQNGLYIGGQGEFSDLFLGHGSWLRGCLSDMVYNDVSPLSRARKRQGKAVAHGISWTCAAEFTAPTSTPISFIDDRSYVALPNLIPRTGATWEFDVRTHSLDGVLMYCSGAGENSDFVGAELINGAVRVVLDKGGGSREVTTAANISDGHWHTVHIMFNSNLAEVSVDGGTPSSTILSISTTKFFDLGHSIYVGGIEVNKRARALSQGIKNADISLKGCIRMLQVASQAVGLPHAKMTEGIVPNCVWSYPCNSNPCLPGVTCVPRGVDSFLCLCDQDVCVKPEFPVSYVVYSRTEDLELVELNSVSIEEGDNIVITTSHINVILDYPKYGVRDTGVLFSTVPSLLPKNGRLVLELWEKSGTLQTFTLLDLATDKVRYVHDGSETLEDEIHLDMELSPAVGYVLPMFLQGQHRISLHVNVTPVNDPPALNVPSTRPLRVPQGGRKIIPPALLNATDPDSPRPSLVYKVIGEDAYGRLEMFGQPNRGITTFTQEDIDKRSVLYYHHGSPPSSYKLTFQVSDGISSSETGILRVSIVPLVLRIINNTGLLVPHYSYAIITLSNLTVTTNSDESMSEITFQIIENCEFGVIERLSSLDGRDVWSATKVFSNLDLAQEIVRYRHTTGKPSLDKFKLKIFSGTTEAQGNHEVIVRLSELILIIKSNKPHNLQNDKQVTLNISVITQPISSDPSLIVFTVTRLPVYGNIMNTGVNGDITQHYLLGSNFTQAELNLQLIKYRMLRRAYVSFNDSVQLKVSASMCSSRKTVVINFEYSPPKKLPHHFTSTITPLKLMEGGSAPIRPSELSINVANVKSLVYEVITGPNHGLLILNDPLTNTTQVNVTDFSPSQISSSRLIYTHDGSENTRDQFSFIALSNLEDDFMIIGNFFIEITLVNDNAPRRVISSVFRIVNGGQRLLTTRHIKFLDDDTDFDSNNLIYTVKNNNNIYSAKTGSIIHQFSQGDIENAQVIVKCDKENSIAVVLTVSDGTHSTDTILDMRPSPPFIELTNNSHLVVSQGGNATLTTSNLFSDTNIDVDTHNIRYVVTSGPSYGALIVSGIDNKTSFTQGEIESGLVLYKHLSSGIAQDRINLKILIGNMSTIGSLVIRIFPPIYWEPLIVLNNKTIYVEEYTSVVISRDHLQISQPGVPPSEVTYVVVEGPWWGYVEVEGTDDNGEDDKGGARTWDQGTINVGSLYYVQAAANQTKDHIVVDVTNGVTWLKSRIINLAIIPNKVYLKGGEVSVKEGGMALIPIELLSTTAPYYSNKFTEFIIRKAPIHGNIVLIQHTSRSISKWSNQQILDNMVHYAHDGSESKSDSVTIVGRTNGKESEPVIITFPIEPVNDMPPVLVNKSSIQLCQGGVAKVTYRNLGVLDEDTPDENITYVIISAEGGHVSIGDNVTASVGTFTQAQINDGSVTFVHDGSKKNFEIEFMIDDGNNRDGPITYRCDVTRPVLTLTINKGIHVFPLLDRVISPDVLKTIVSDTRKVTYTILEGPTAGNLLLLDDGISQIVKEFTQDDIDSLKLSYKHTVPFSEPVLLDQFVFNVSSPFTKTLSRNVFKIEVSVMSGGGLESEIINLEVVEGGFAPILFNTSSVTEFLSNEVKLASVKLEGIVTFAPSYASLCKVKQGEDYECNITTLTENDLNKGLILYKHDDSDTFDDYFLISLYLNSEVLLFNISYNVVIIPVNDSPFTLLTHAPELNVVRDQSVAITNDILYTKDPDTSPKDILYEIVSGPSIGTILLGNMSTESFTQSDIDSGRVLFKHSGPLESTSFYIRVSDGKFNAVYTVVKVNVNEIKINVTSVMPVEMMQGSSEVIVPPTCLAVSTNAAVSDIFYNMTSSPRHGSLFIADNEITSLGHDDLIKGRLIYRQEDMKAAGDSFQLTPYHRLGLPVLKPVWLNVSVVPLITIGQFNPVSGTRAQLDLSVLNATELAQVSRSNPLYRLLKKPSYGKIRKIIRSFGEEQKTREKDVMKFTHEEISSGLIYYISKRSNEALEETLSFVVTAPPLQPAVGGLTFKIAGESPSTTFKPPKPRTPGTTSNHDVQIASPNMSEDYLLGVSMVTCVVALSFIIVAFVRCNSKNGQYVESKSVGEPLPQPPDDIMAPVTPVPPPPPIALSQQHNVTLPPGRLDHQQQNPPHDVNLRYPYGDEDCSVEHSTSTEGNKVANPILRKNQYWV
ncbi:hypothetical protein O3M35_003808 [Rhynocoris fuscipes]|uniref:Laminin G domain-containing protein n=1 Tax=Rhynocoris fuscipes TaxID=488301 RepID=A0AAW1CN28_9HEMI